VTERDVDVLREDIRGLSSNVATLGSQVSAMGATLAIVASQVKDHSSAISEVRDIEISCPARAREITGPVADSKADAKPQLLTLSIRVLPWALLVGVAIGAFIASGGKTQASEDAIRKTISEIQVLKNSISKIESKAP